LLRLALCIVFSLHRLHDRLMSDKVSLQLALFHVHVGQIVICVKLIIGKISEKIKSTVFVSLPLSSSCRLPDTRRVFQLDVGLASAAGLGTLVYARRPPSNLTQTPGTISRLSGLLTILVKSIAIFNTNARPKKYCQYQYQ